MFSYKYVKNGGVCLNVASSHDHLLKLLGLNKKKIHPLPFSQSRVPSERGRSYWLPLGGQSYAFNRLKGRSGAELQGGGGGRAHASMESHALSHIEFKKKKNPGFNPKHHPNHYKTKRFPKIRQDKAVVV